MNDPEKLKTLADWFDRTQDDPTLRHLLGWSDGREVQDDLRRIARELEEGGATKPKARP